MSKKNIFRCLGFFLCGILIGGVVAVLFIYVVPPFDRRKINCDRVPYSRVDKVLKGDDKIDAIEANLATIVDGGLQRAFDFKNTYKLELKSQSDLFVFIDKDTSKIGIEDQTSYMRPFSQEKLFKWTFGTGFIMRPGNCRIGLDKKYNETTVSFESVQSPRSYLAMKENSTDLQLVKVDLEDGKDHTCSAWSTCFVLSRSDTENTLIGSVEYPG